MGLFDSIGGLFSSLFATDPPKYEPQNYGLSYAQMQQNVPQYQYQQPNMFNVGQSQLYGQTQGNVNRMEAGGQALPPEYRQAVLGQAQRELGLQEQRAQSEAAEQANKMNLLGSGSLAVRQGRIGEQYTRAYKDVLDNLTQQEFSERARMQNMLAGFEGQRQAGSQFAGGLQAQGQQQAAQMAMQRAMALIQQQQGQAGQQYASDVARWGSGEQARGAGISNLTNLFGMADPFSWFGGRRSAPSGYGGYTPGSYTTSAYTAGG